MYCTMEKEKYLHRKNIFCIKDIKQNVCFAPSAYRRPTRKSPNSLCCRELGVFQFLERLPSVYRLNFLT